MAERIVLGLSGGVDSAVSARLLEQDGCKVVGVFLDIGDGDAQAAARLAAQELAIPLEVIDIRARLEEKVCRPFAAGYLRGETPNPCILCNPAVKFPALLEAARQLGADRVATGHYARAEGGAILKGRPNNDQSYMLCRLTREQAARLVLPLGPYEKTEVRAMAAQMGLSASERPDSMEICFIPRGGYADWLRGRGDVPPPGPVLFRGREVARHEGIHRWTVGQRLPVMADGRKLYVKALLPGDNAVIAGLWEELFTDRFRVRDLSWLIEPPAGPLRASVRVRHTKWETPDCTVTPDGEVRCGEPVRAPAPGQAAAFYVGERLAGGGIIL